MSNRVRKVFIHIERDYGDEWRLLIEFGRYWGSKNNFTLESARRYQTRAAALTASILCLRKLGITLERVVVDE